MSNDRRREERADDAVVEAAWRAASSDEPSASIDAAILAAARAEVLNQPRFLAAFHRQPWWNRWQPLAAAAGVAGLAFVLVQLVPREERLHKGDDAPYGNVAPSPTAPAVPLESAAPAPTTTAPAVPAAPATARSRQSAPAYVTPGVTAEADAVAETTPPVAMGSAAVPLSPADWAQRISALHSAGNLQTAAAELNAFRRSYADADQHLAETLRDWAASVPATDVP
jgi:hypothetical protein